MIHVMAVTGLGGTAMSAPVVGDGAIAAVKEEQHLGVPIIGRQRPAVAKHDGLTFAPVLVLDLSPIFRRNCRHVLFSIFLMFCLRDCQTSICKGCHISDGRFSWKGPFVLELSLRSEARNLLLLTRE